MEGINVCDVPEDGLLLAAHAGWNICAGLQVLQVVGSKEVHFFHKLLLAGDDLLNQLAEKHLSIYHYYT